MNYDFIIKDVFGENILRMDDRGNIQWGGLNKTHTQRIATFSSLVEAEAHIEAKKLINAVVEKVYNLNSYL